MLQKFQQISVNIIKEPADRRSSLLSAVIVAESLILGPLILRDIILLAPFIRNNQSETCSRNFKNVMEPKVSIEVEQ